MTKTFPKSRVCIVNIYPAVKQGVRLSLDFASKHNINISSKDGRNILLSTCLTEVQKTYKQTNSPFRKVCFIDRTNLETRLEYFVETYFNKIMSQVPIPYCGVVNSTSPDLEFVAEKCLQQHKSQKNFEKLKQFLKLKVS